MAVRILLALFSTSAFLALALAPLPTSAMAQDRSPEPTQFSSFKPVQAYANFLEKSKILNLGAAGTVFVSGGFGSCDPTPNRVELYENLMEHLWKRAEVGEYYRIVAACFGYGNQTVYYFSSDRPDKILSGSAARVLEALRRQIALAGTPDTFILGHSYGGWLALHHATKLKPSEVNILGLATIDPISTVLCTPTTFINAYLNSMFSLQPDPQCTRAPADIDEEQLATLGNTATWWHNFYQFNSSFLHSGPIAGAANHEIDYNFTQPWEIVRGHGSIDTDERVWSILRPLLQVDER